MLKIFDQWHPKCICTSRCFCACPRPKLEYNEECLSSWLESISIAAFFNFKWNNSARFAHWDYIFRRISHICAQNDSTIIHCVQDITVGDRISSILPFILRDFTACCFLFAARWTTLVKVVLTIFSTCFGANFAPISLHVVIQKQHKTGSVTEDRWCTPLN